MSKLAILGGEKTFPQGIPFNQPTTPQLAELLPDLEGIFASGMLTKGKLVREYEEKAADYVGVKEAVGLVNCTTGLLLLVRALGLKGEVIVPSFTFFASVHVLVWNGIRPVFADCLPDTFTIDPLDAERKITPLTSAILPVHVAGNPIDIDALEEIASKHKIKLITDSAHGFGTRYKGRQVGFSGNGEVFSTSPTKLLCTGEGGMLTTNDTALAEEIRVLLEYGNAGDYDCQSAGLNGRLAEINALLGIKGLDILEENVAKRHKIAACYKENIGDLPGITFQKINPHGRTSYKDVSVLVNEEEFGLSRDVLAQILKAEGIPTRFYFYPPCHLLKVYRQMYPPVSLPVTERISRQIISLPMFSHMTCETNEKICQAIRQIYQSRYKLKK